MKERSVCEVERARAQAKGCSDPVGIGPTGSEMCVQGGATEGRGDQSRERCTWLCAVWRHSSLAT